MKKKRILLVDDDAKITRLVKLLLEREGAYEVLCENRPARALAAAHEFQPDAILLDVDMPGKDGGEVARDIRARRELQHVPIMFISSLVGDSEAGRRPVMREGIPFYPKPSRPMELADTLTQALATIF